MSTPEPQPPKKPRAKRTTQAPLKVEDSLNPGQNIRATLESAPPETAAEVESRLRIKEDDAAHQRLKELVFIVLVAVVTLVCLYIVGVPGYDADTRGKAVMLLGVIVSGAGTYLFTRPKS